ncbi:MAG TPA: archaeosortase/exosortase family protein [Polyangiaceae bacterium]|nr:archaeosortase/exosortase family protein [Polyangiaceae bacterium]
MLPAGALPRAAVEARTPRALLALSLGVGAGQCVLAWRLGELEFALTVTVAWVAALTVAHDRWPAARSSPRPPLRALGAALAAAAMLVLSGAPYRPSDRAMPLVAGAGVAIAAYGLRDGLGRWRELAFLLLPFVNPMPRPIRMAIGPARLTAFCAMVLDRFLGHPVSLDGEVLASPTATLDVAPDCSGISGIARLCALAALVVALFPTATRKKVWVFGTAVAVGFVTNVPRIAILVNEASRRNDGRFDYWHQGDGATVFSVLSTTIAVFVWWLMLRGPRKRETLD